MLSLHLTYRVRIEPVGTHRVRCALKPPAPRTTYCPVARGVDLRLEQEQLAATAADVATTNSLQEVGSREKSLVNGSTKCNWAPILSKSGLITRQAPRAGQLHSLPPGLIHQPRIS